MIVTMTSLFIIIIAALMGLAIGAPLPRGVELTTRESHNNGLDIALYVLIPVIFLLSIVAILGWCLHIRSKRALGASVMGLRTMTIELRSALALTREQARDGTLDVGESWGPRPVSRRGHRVFCTTPMRPLPTVEEVENGSSSNHSRQTTPGGPLNSNPTHPPRVEGEGSDAC
ncbi:hypothetical protein B0T16DRAFT_512272 [Cercophora newfieldiana]|uniref:Uncharacterized protein n=1 Tax=Cercophora newfieldiana TaxID=92897 RepID=A0AA39XZH6_9PEZI|nr:hypothetical protein B0T16DRAFT_512272 [Cercophora newfieldiana]